MMVDSKEGARENNKAREEREREENSDGERSGSGGAKRGREGERVWR